MTLDVNRQSDRRDELPRLAADVVAQWVAPPTRTSLLRPRPQRIRRIISVTTLAKFDQMLGLTYVTIKLIFVLCTSNGSS